MEKFKTCKSKVIPIPIKNVDTDQIIPARFLTSVSREGYGNNVFRDIRDSTPDFPFNKKHYDCAEVLVSDANFGCGSSREHAVWALVEAGIRVIIGKSFADIFHSNSAKNGLLLVTLPENIIDKMLSQAANEEFVLTVDLEQQVVLSTNEENYSFDYDAFRKHCLLNGLNDIDYIRSHEADIRQYRAQKTNVRFYSTTQPNVPIN